MVSISSSRKAFNTTKLVKVVTILVLCLAVIGASVQQWQYYSSMTRTTGMEAQLNVYEEETTTTTEPKQIVLSLEQIEEHLKRIDPDKAKQWKQFLQQRKEPKVVEKQADDPTPSKRPKEDEPQQQELTTSLESLEEQRAQLNSERIRKWRKGFEEAAATDDSDQHRLKTKEFATNAFPVQNLRKCQYIMIDFGSNIGDSLHKMIDSSFPEFDAGLTGNDKGEKLHPVLNTTSGNVGDYSAYDFGGRPNPNKWILPKWVKGSIVGYNEWRSKKNKNVNHNVDHDDVYPEDYCFYGIEGNPHFTPMLQKEEIQIMNMVPRPVRHVHFLTEHVGAGKDGPTTLYLDTVNPKDNFWGSSVYNTHVDVVKSKNTGIPVMGITLTRLLNETALPGGHVMIKIDIEGGEYPLLEEAIESNIFCTLVKEKGIKIDMLNERHNAKIVGSEEPGQHWKEIQGDQKIKKCGVGYGWTSQHAGF
mmetsp:Transcript_24160/g.36543  ORF Transcript_24160/g.36543 Transcript_24160/m.36543 type:complete len:473 (+) Transcript_24160:96-1514(+)